MFVKTREKFADEVGVTHKTVYAMCDRGYLPTVRFGRRVFINLVALKQICESAAESSNFTAPACPHGGGQPAAGEGAPLLGNTIRNRLSEGQKQALKETDA